MDPTRKRQRRHRDGGGNAADTGTALEHRVAILAVQAAVRRGSAGGALREILDAIAAEFAQQSPAMAAAMEV